MSFVVASRHTSPEHHSSGEVKNVKSSNFGAPPYEGPNLTNALQQTATNLIFNLTDENSVKSTWIQVFGVTSDITIKSNENPLAQVFVAYEGWIDGAFFDENKGILGMSFNMNNVEYTIHIQECTNNFMINKPKAVLTYLSKEFNDEKFNNEMYLFKPHYVTTTTYTNQEAKSEVTREYDTWQIYHDGTAPDWKTPMDEYMREKRRAEINEQIRELQLRREHEENERQKRIIEGWKFNESSPKRYRTRFRNEVESLTQNNFRAETYGNTITVFTPNLTLRFYYNIHTFFEKRMFVVQKVDNEEVEVPYKLYILMLTGEYANFTDIFRFFNTSLHNIVQEFIAKVDELKRGPNYDLNEEVLLSLKEGTEDASELSGFK